MGPEALARYRCRPATAGAGRSPRSRTRVLFWDIHRISSAERWLLTRESASRGVKDQLADKLGLDVVEAAAAVLVVMHQHGPRHREHHAEPGHRPARRGSRGGWRRRGSNAVAIARQLGCEQVLVPPVAAVLSAAGELIAELTADYASTLHTTSSGFDAAGVGASLSHLQQQCNDFISRSGVGALESAVSFTVEARYADQAWNWTSRFGRPVRSMVVGHRAER